MPTLHRRNDMPGATFTSREFNQDTSRAKKAADAAPVFITDRGRPAYVLMNVADYKRLTETGSSIVDLLAMPGDADITFEPARVLAPLSRPADLD